MISTKQFDICTSVLLWRKTSTSHVGKCFFFFFNKIFWFETYWSSLDFVAGKERQDVVFVNFPFSTFFSSDDIFSISLCFPRFFFFNTYCRFSPFDTESQIHIEKNKIKIVLPGQKRGEEQATTRRLPTSACFSRYTSKPPDQRKKVIKKTKIS